MRRQLLNSECEVACCTVSNRANDCPQSAHADQDVQTTTLTLEKGPVSCSAAVPPDSSCGA